MSSIETPMVHWMDRPEFDRMHNNLFHPGPSYWALFWMVIGALVVFLTGLHAVAVILFGVAFLPELYRHLMEFRPTGFLEQFDEGDLQQFVNEYCKEMVKLGMGEAARINSLTLAEHYASEDEETTYMQCMLMIQQVNMGPMNQEEVE